MCYLSDKCYQKFTEKVLAKMVSICKNISALVPIFEKITEVVRGVQCIERKTLNELFGDVAALQDSLVDIEKRLLVTQGVGLSASVYLLVSAVLYV